MHRIRSVVIAITILGLSLGVLRPGLGIEVGMPVQAATPYEITLSTASGATAVFRTQNGMEVDGNPSDARVLPYLVLRRNGKLTPADERTLIFDVSNISVPRGGATVELTLRTQHGDPDQGGGVEHQIAVLTRSIRLVNQTKSTRTESRVTFRIAFPDKIATGTEVISVPSDYYRASIRITDQRGRLLMSQTLDYAFLMEDQVVMPLLQSSTNSENAGPQELIVYYLDMIPYQNRTASGIVQLPRQNVPDFVTDLARRFMVATWVQTHDWGFMWYPEWQPYRQDQTSDQLTVALTDGETWFHGQAPEGGHSGISLNVSDRPGISRYATLTETMVSYFHHELFHNLQRSIDLHNGGSGNVDGQDDAWQIFSEGTAVLATSVGAQSVEFLGQEGRGFYMVMADRFVGGNGLSGDLNTSYSTIDPYAFGVYWRFLYEQCDGMDVIHQILDVLYTGEVVNIHDTADMIPYLPEIISRGLVRSGCRYTTFEESLSAFAYALYGLTQDAGHCAALNCGSEAALYDPAHRYTAPEAADIFYEGGRVTYDRTVFSRPPSIPNSFGIDFIEIRPMPNAADQLVTIAFETEKAARARFVVQVWSLTSTGSTPTLEATMHSNGDGSVSRTVRLPEVGSDCRLALLITRVDTQEGLDPLGTYAVELHARSS